MAWLKWIYLLNVYSSQNPLSLFRGISHILFFGLYQMHIVRSWFVVLAIGSNVHRATRLLLSNRIKWFFPHFLGWFSAFLSLNRHFNKCDRIQRKRENYYRYAHIVKWNGSTIRSKNRNLRRIKSHPTNTEPCFVLYCRKIQCIWLDQRKNMLHHICAMNWFIHFISTHFSFW